MSEQAPYKKSLGKISVHAHYKKSLGKMSVRDFSFSASPRSRNAHGHFTSQEPFCAEFTGNWPDTDDTTTTEHRALTLTITYHKNPCVATLLGEKQKELARSHQENLEGVRRRLLVSDATVSIQNTFFHLSPFTSILLKVHVEIEQMECDSMSCFSLRMNATCSNLRFKPVPGDPAVPSKHSSPRTA